MHLMHFYEKHNKAKKNPDKIHCFMDDRIWATILFCKLQYFLFQK